ncbi:PAS domain-containing protein [Nostoc sp. XA013]|nr:PAS domain-containing protein [Nostoc sp. XA013]
MVRQGLLVELRATIYQAQRQKILVRKEGLQIEQGNLSKIINLEVIPFKPSTDEEFYFLILFEEAPATVNNLSTVNSESQEQPDLEQEIVRLRLKLANANQERAATQEYLQAVIQEQEHINQDLKVANEEILSSNEELQSTNEELETAKEEIQATNEELNTTNEELRSRNLELHQVNNDLTNLLGSINIPILILTSDLRVRRFTPMAQRLFNLIPTDAGRPLSDIRANLDVPDLEPLILEVLDTLSIKELEVQTLGGHWYNLRIRPYRTTENQIDGVVLVLIDIDVLKGSAATLEQARNYAEAIVETVQVPLLVLDSDFRVNKANRSFYETFQVLTSETTQSLIFELGNGQWNLPGLQQILEDILANDTTIQNLEVEHRFEQIGQKTMLINGWKIVQQGESQRILLAIEDISDRKQFELERSQLLAQEQSARQEAENANQAKNEFLSNLSHELRNPLNTILGWAQLFRTRNLDSEAVTRAWEVVERSANVQAQLIDDMLDLSRITSGKLHLKTRLIDLVSVVNAAIESIEFSAEAKGIQIVSQLNSATVVGDFDRLQQVLWNLLSNAIKFTPGDGRVGVMLEAVYSHAEIRVSDTGIGIPADLLPYVFERFRQGDSSSSKTTQGLGLGLSIVRHIVELHGGTVQAQSRGQGQGTTIIIRLPLRSMPQQITPPTYLEPSLLSETPDTLDGKYSSLTLEGLCILAVDDQRDSRDLIKWMLEDFGAEVVVVTSAREAIAALIQSPGRYDLLLADIGMPEEDGYFLIRQVRELEAEAGGQIPAAAISAYVTEQERQRAIDAGFQMHLAKPIELTQLILMIAKLSGRITDNS